MPKYQVIRWDSPDRLNAEELRRKLISEGFSVYQWSDAAGVFYPPHSHPNDQSHWIISGQIEFDVEDAGKFLLKAGDRDFMPAQTKHSAKVIGSQSVVYLIGEK